MLEDPRLSSDPDTGRNEKVVMWSYPIIQDGLIYAVDIRNGFYVLRVHGPARQEGPRDRFPRGQLQPGRRAVLRAGRPPAAELPVRTRLARIAPFLVTALILGLPTLDAVGALGPLNDLLALGQGGGQTPGDGADPDRTPAPPLVATPRANCGPGSKPEPDIQGRVPAGSATEGLWCNVTLVAPPRRRRAASRSSATSTRRATSARTTTPRCCSRSTRFNLDATSLGVAVLDMSEPAPTRCRRPR